MGIQSAVMAKQFGENFQYGKRRISAMSNDEFNKLTPALLQANANAELKAMIPSMEASITDMRKFQEFMIKEMLFMVGDMLRNGLGFLLGVTGSQVNTAIQDIEHFLHGHGGLQGHQADEPIGPPTEPIADIAPPPPSQTIPPVVDVVTPSPPSITPSKDTGMTGEIRNSSGELIFLLKHSIGMVMFHPTLKNWVTYTNFPKTTWQIIFHSNTQVEAIRNAAASWPSKNGYKIITSLPPSERARRFWIHTSKLP